MHTYIHKYIHKYIHTHIHTDIHTYIHTYIHTIHTNIQTCIHTYIHTFIPTHTDTYIQAYIYIHRFSVQTRSWIGPRAVHQPGCKQHTMTRKPSSFSDLSRVGTRPKGHFTARQFRDVTSSDGRHHFLERFLRGVRQFQLVESLLYQMIHRASV